MRVLFLLLLPSLLSLCPRGGVPCCLLAVLWLSPFFGRQFFGLLPVVSIEDTLVVRCVQGQMCSPVRVAVGALEEVELMFRLVLLDDGDSCLWSLDVATLFVAFCIKWR